MRKSSIQQDRNGNEKLTQQKASWKNLTYQLRHSELSRKEKEIEPVNNNSAILYHLQSEKRKKKESVKEKCGHISTTSFQDNQQLQHLSSFRSETNIEEPNIHA